MLARINLTLRMAAFRPTCQTLFEAEVVSLYCLQPRSSVRRARFPRHHLPLIVRHRWIQGNSRRVCLAGQSGGGLDGSLDGDDVSIEG
jgi:hypothetical protein